MIIRHFKFDQFEISRVHPFMTHLSYICIVSGPVLSEYNEQQRQSFANAVMTIGSHYECKTFIESGVLYVAITVNVRAQDKRLKYDILIVFISTNIFS